MTKKAYSIPEFCAAYGVGRTKVYSEIGAGKLKTLKNGSKNLIRAEDADAWLNSLAAPHSQLQAA